MKILWRLFRQVLTPAITVDLRMTADGELVVTHDSTLERTTNGKGIVEKTTAAELRKLRTKKGNKLIFLDELLEFLKPIKGLYVEFEMKTSPVEYYPEERLKEYCDKLYSAVMSARPDDAEYVFTSSDYRGLRYLQQIHPGVDLLMITSKPCNAETIDLALALGIKRIGCTMDGTSRQAVKKAHDKGLIVSLWPGYSPDDFMLGAYLGADIFTNESNVNTFCTVKFNQKSENVTINTAPNSKYGYTIRLVKEIN